MGSVGGGNRSGGDGGGGGPCGACKFLRRKCVKGCVFAAYFDAENGVAQFAAVHKVFGASNASKLLLRLPPHRRRDAVISLCYEALARLRDPVYGCVAHIFALQQQVMNLQAELAFIQARLSTMQRLCLLPLPQPHDRSLELASAASLTSAEMESLCSPSDIYQLDNDGDLHELAQAFVTRYLPSVRVRPSGSG